MRGSESISLQLGKEGRHISVRPSRVVDALWAWAAGTTAGSADLAPRLTFGPAGVRLAARIDGRDVATDVVVAGDSLADADLVVPAAGISIELRPYHRHTSLTVLQPTVLTLAAPEDWSALAQDATVGPPLPNCLVGVAAMHLFDRDFRAPGCVNHHLLYSPRAVSDAVRHHVCALERDRRRAVSAIAGSMTNEEWV